MSNFAARRRRLLASVHAAGALVTDPVDVRYLTGLATSHAALLIMADRTVLATDGRYETAARRDCPDLELVIARDTVANVAIYIPSGAFIAFDSARTAMQEFTAMSEWPVWWEPRPDFTAPMRAIKDSDEVEIIAAACAITAQAMMATFERVRPGLTERQIAGIFEQQIRELGADGPSFDTIVATGEHSAIPHHEPGERVLERGDFVLIDAGAKLRGYHADMTRTAVLGTPAAWQRDLHAAVEAAQALGRSLAVPGASDVDARVKQAILEATGGQMPHGTGHGIGLAIHEPPMMASTSPDTIPAGATMTVEPGMYLPGRGGVRIEDSGHITGSGYQVLTVAPYDLLELD